MIISLLNQYFRCNSVFIMKDWVQASYESKKFFSFYCSIPSLACPFTSVTLHPSIFLCLSHRPSRVLVSHQSCAASRLILPSPIIEGLNYWACQPPSGEPFVMWTGLDQTERGCLGFAVVCAGQRGTHMCLSVSVPAGKHSSCVLDWAFPSLIYTTMLN